MGQKISYEAESVKQGMSLQELLTNLQKAAGLAQVNNKPLEDCKVTTFVNIRAGIKQIVVEV